MGIFRNKTGQNRGLPETPAYEKALGPKISARPRATPSNIDGDGDGFVSGPDGRDNIPAPVAQVAETAKSVWDNAREKQLKQDEERVKKVAERLQKRTPKYDIPKIKSLITGARNREDAIAARKMTEEWAKSIFEMDNIGENGEYKVRLFRGSTGVNIMGRRRSVLAAHDEDPYLHVRISGRILDKDGKSVGQFERHVYLDDYNSKKKPHVYHEILRLDESARGKGIGSDFTIGTENMYAKLGIDSIYLNAGLSDGAYTWLRAGYGFKDDAERVKAAKALEERYQTLLKDAGSKEKLVAGGFTTRVGRYFSDDDSTSDGVEMPTPFLESMEDLDKFLKMLGRLKGNPVGSENELPPANLTVFGDFSKRILRGMNFDVSKTVRDSSTGQKTVIVVHGFDKLFTK